MAKLKAYFKKEDIPEPLVEYYVERDGQWLPDFDGIKTQKDIDNVKAATAAEREQRIELQKKLDKIPDDFDAELWKKVKHLDPEKANDTAERLQALEANWQQKLDQEKAKTREWQERYNSTILKSELTDALVAVNVKSPVLRKAAMKLLEDQLEIADNKVVDKTLRRPVKEFIQEWAQSEEGREFVAAPDNSGGGAGNSGGNGSIGGNNPFKPDENGVFNRTAAGQLIKQDPEKARKLARAAGWDNDSIYW